MMVELYSNGKFPKGENASFIALIPKTYNPQGLDDFRPISLIGCICKVITRVLAKRLRQIIDERQCAFVGGRNMLDGVLIANEMVEGKKSYVVFKVDFEKAYELVSWSFLLYMMKRLGFRE